MYIIYLTIISTHLVFYSAMAYRPYEKFAVSPLIE